MKNSKLTIAALTLALATTTFAAHAADKESYESKVKVEKDAKGNYEKEVKTESHDASGTKVTNNESVEVDANSDGTKETTIKTKAVSDPKGLMNSSTVETEKKIEENADGTKTISNQKKVDGKTVIDEKKVQ